jgi:Transposase/Transposase IS116/IS110/IS902 family
MNANSITQSPGPDHPSFVAWIGLDWGQDSHAFALDDHSGQIQEGPLTHSAEALHGWLQQLSERFGGRPVALAIEASRGPVVAALLHYPWLTIYPINPLTSARYRQAFTPSGAKDDQPDARVLLELVRDHCAKLRPLELQDTDTQMLDALVQARRDMVDRRTQVLNQLTALLKTYYPQAFALVGNLNSELAADFLSRWPDLLTLKAARPGTIKRFYYAHNLRRPELLEQRLALIGRAVCLTAHEVTLRAAVLQLRLLLDQWRVFHRHIPALDDEIKEVFRRHPEAPLFANLPGAGSALGPRLCAAFGTRRTLHPSPASLQKLAGVAPVREKSGHQLWTHWRWQAPRFLRQTFVEWAGQTVVHCRWARAYYQHMVAKGKTHQVILRALAFKWIRVLWRCWQTHTPYDDSRYLRQLLKRKSPHALTA